MNKKPPITKHTLFLRAGDFDKLKESFPNIGASAIVRKVVARFVDEHVDKPPSKSQVNELSKQIEGEI